ncbi:MAG: hypothetical protein ABR598_04960 [Candidatus Dormibacteria bacterium]
MPRSPILLGSSSERDRAMRAAGARIAIGALLGVFPGMARRTFGIPAAQDNGALRMISRLFGIRNVVLGVWALQVQGQGPEVRRQCYQLNAAVDALDIGALLIGAVAGEGLVQGAVMGSLLGSSEVLAWLDLLGDVDSPAEPQGSVALA